MEFVLTNDVVTLCSFLEFTTAKESNKVDGDGSCVGGRFDLLKALADAYKIWLLWLSLLRQLKKLTR